MRNPFKKQTTSEAKAITALMSGQTPVLSIDDLAEILRTTPNALEAFERAYTCATTDELSGKAEAHDAISDSRELASQLGDAFYDCYCGKALPASPADVAAICDVNAIATMAPEERPLCVPGMAKIDMPNSSAAAYAMYKMATDIVPDTPQKAALARHCYGTFRAMLDVLDLDAVTYAALGCNKASFGYWFGALEAACAKSDAISTPKSKCVRVPLEILQTTRISESNAVTDEIVDEFCMRAFDLDESKTYFVKTGIVSMKYDFRNCVVGPTADSPHEVRELGEYLLYLNRYAGSMAHLTNMRPDGSSAPAIYGANTTNEWVVREFIADKDCELTGHTTPTIYHGMPLHTEFRLFVDLDTDDVLSCVNYWDPKVMMDRFTKGSDANTPDMLHDAVTYKAYEPTLVTRYEANRDRVIDAVRAILPDMDLSGQWSLDVMMNGDDLWAIDMAPAETSAFYGSVPKALRRPMTQDWIPALPQR